jgi:hypothetical protein
MATGDLRRRREKQRIADQEAADELPQQQAANDRQRAGEITAAQ